VDPKLPRSRRLAVDEACSEQHHIAARSAMHIKKALMKEQGVASVTVRYEKKALIVSFDDAKTTPDAIMKSTAAVGIPSQIAR
jgi:copper chaperone CopZ